MGEIKFRGKDLLKNKWVYGYLSEIFGEDSRRFTIDEAMSFDVEGNSLNVFEVYPDTIGQFIGICDKNVKEIYADDIVIYNHNGNIIRGIVVFKDLAYQVKYKDQDMFDAYLRLFDWSGEHIEVIGNIHENPELL